MRNPRALADWADLNDFGLQLPPDLVPISDPFIDLGIQLAQSVTTTKAETPAPATAPRPAATDVAA